jgi:hypothetical protein
MAEPLAKTAAPPRKPCFAIAQSDAGDWVARECRGGVERRFPTQKAALHFVLFDRRAHAAAALLTPRPGDGA